MSRHALNHDDKLSVGEEFLFVFVISAQGRCSSCASKKSTFLMLAKFHRLELNGLLEPVSYEKLLGANKL